MAATYFAMPVANAVLETPFAARIQNRRMTIILLLCCRISYGEPYHSVTLFTSRVGVVLIPTNAQMSEIKFKCNKVLDKPC